MMSISVDCSDIITQVDQQCRLEGRQPTQEEYNFIISYLQQTNVHLQQTIMQLQQDKNELARKNETLDSKFVLSLQDKEKSLELLPNEHLEVSSVITHVVCVLMYAAIHVMVMRAHVTS